MVGVILVLRYQPPIEQWQSNSPIVLHTNTYLFLKKYIYPTCFHHFLRQGKENDVEMSWRLKLSSAMFVVSHEVHSPILICTDSHDVWLSLKEGNQICCQVRLLLSTSWYIQCLFCLIAILLPKNYMDSFLQDIQPQPYKSMASRAT